MIYERYPHEFELQEAIDLLTEVGENENDVKFLLASFIRSGYADYVGRSGYKWFIELDEEEIESIKLEIENEKEQNSQNGD